MNAPRFMTDVLGGVDGTGVVDAAERLVRIPSMGGTESEVEVQRFLADAWRSDGLDVDEWDIDVPALQSRTDFPGMEVERTTAVGVSARLPGTGNGPTLLLLGHTDVVPPGDPTAWHGDPFTPSRHADALIGRGTCDMKAGMAAAWYAVRALQHSGLRLRGDVVLAAVSGEEDGGLGTFALIDHGITADACIVPEPTNLDLVPANGGALTFRIRVRGAATHASRRTEGVSAIEKFVPVLAALAGLEQTRNATVDPLMARWSLAYPLSIGTVHAGDWASTVPDLLIAEGRLGVALDESVADARAALERAVAEASAADPWLAEHPVEVEWWGGQFASGRTDPASPFLGRLATTAADLQGRAPQVYGGPYGSDLRLLVGAGIPTVQYGPGDSAAAHAPNEWVSMADLVTCTRVLAAFAADFCGIDS